MAHPEEDLPAQRRFKSSVVVGKAQPVPSGARTRPSARGPQAAGGMADEFRARTRPGFSAFGLFGAVLLVLCLTSLILNFSLPWTSLGGQDLDRGDMDRQSTTDYGHRLLGWPLVSYIFGMILGVGLIVVDLVPNLVGVQRILQVVLSAGAGYFGFLTALTGFRFLGAYFSALWSGNPADYHLHVVPYLNLVVGLLMVAGAVWTVRLGAAFFTEAASGGALTRHALRVPAWTLLVAAATLCALPLLPFAVVDQPLDDAYWGEGALLTFSEAITSGPNDNPGNDLGYAQGMLWIAFYLGLATLAFALVDRLGMLPQLWGTLSSLAYGLIAVPLLVALIFTILLYVDIPKMEGTFGGDVKLAFNYILPVGVLALAALYVMFAVKVMAPFFQTMRREASFTA